jgi:hypothetical protein
VTRFSTSGPSDATTYVVAITSVNTVTRRATGLTRQRSQVEIDVSLHVGGLQITPSVGEHWIITRSNSFYYRMVSQIPENAPEMLTEAQQGQVQIGSKGPLELYGSQVNFHAPPVLASYATADRPSATQLGPGATIFDLDLSKPVFSDGAVWRDAMGTAV